MRRVLWIALVGAVGCASEMTKEEKEFEAQMYLGAQMYNGSKFEEAVRAYARATELKRDNFDAYLGLGQSAAELSLTLYTEAERLSSINKKALAEKALQSADDYHTVSNKAFGKAQQLQPSDTIVNYYVGLMLYKRATTPFNMPYPASPVPPKALQGDPEQVKAYMRGVEQRQKERDGAIEEFQKVLRSEAVPIDSPEHPAKCKSAQAHRYLALTYLTRSDFEKGDIENFRRQLTVYLAWLEEFRVRIVKGRKNQTQEQKAIKEHELEQIDRELLDVREILVGWRENLIVLERQIQLNLDECPIPLEKRPMRLQSITQEKLLMEGLIAQFDKARHGAAKKP